MESRPRLTGEFQRRVKAFDDDAPDGNTFPSSRNRGLMLDPETGLTIARRHTDGYLLGFAKGSRYVVAYHETDEGVPYLHLLEPKLSVPPR